MASRLVDLYREHGPTVFARCRRILGDDEAAIEATTATFERRARDRRVDARLLEETAEAVCLERLPPGRLAVVTGTDDPAAADRFRRLYLAKALPAIERAERPPLVLRYVWFVAPIFVATAMTGMFLAARSAARPESRADGTAGLEVYGVRGGHTYRVAAGAHLHRGEAVRLVVIPAGAVYASVELGGRGGRVLAALGPLTGADRRVEVREPLVVDAPGHLHIVAVLRSAARAVEVSFDAEVE